MSKPNKERVYIIAGDVVVTSLDSHQMTVETVNVEDQTAKTVWWNGEKYIREVIALNKLIIVG